MTAGLWPNPLAMRISSATKGSSLEKLLESVGIIAQLLSLIRVLHSIKCKEQWNPRRDPPEDSHVEPERYRLSTDCAKWGLASIPRGFINVTRNPKPVPILPV
jgi:hypothetical protein